MTRKVKRTTRRQATPELMKKARKVSKFSYIIEDGKQLLSVLLRPTKGYLVSKIK